MKMNSKQRLACIKFSSIWGIGMFLYRVLIRQDEVIRSAVTVFVTMIIAYFLCACLVKSRFYKDRFKEP
jgi:hypothetical protein